MLQMATLDAEKQEEDKLDEENGGATRPVVDPKDYHLKESLAITADYLRLVRVVRAGFSAFLASFALAGPLPLIGSSISR